MNLYCFAFMTVIGWIDVVTQNVHNHLSSQGPKLSECLQSNVCERRQEWFLIGSIQNLTQLVETVVALWVWVGNKEAKEQGLSENTESAMSGKTWSGGKGKWQEKETWVTLNRILPVVVFDGTETWQLYGSNEDQSTEGMDSEVHIMIWSKLVNSQAAGFQ